MLEIHKGRRIDLRLNEKCFNMRIDENFGLEVPISVPGVEDLPLRFRDSWDDKVAYDVAAQGLVAKFIANFEKFELHVDDNVRGAAPRAA